jgi:ribonuclease-3
MIHPLLEFHDEQLLWQALTHRSYANEHPGEHHNERLEFLGDAVLNFISASYLYRNYPEIEEDEMTRRRSALVDEKQLALFADKTGITLRMRIGEGMMRAGGYQNPNLRSSTFEAVVGAYYLDRKLNLEQLIPILEELFETVPHKIMKQRSSLDPKNQLQQKIQRELGNQLPQYVTERVGGADHSPEYATKVFIANVLYGEGHGKNRKDSERQAADDALVKIKLSGFGNL